LAKNDKTSSSNATDATDVLMGATGAEETAGVPTVEEILAADPAVVQAQILQMNLATAKLNFEAARRAAALSDSQEVQDDAELKATQLKTARLDMLLAQERNQGILESREERIARRKAALQAMEQEAQLALSIQEGCAHRVGGFDLADTYNGDGKTSIVCSTLPVLGMELLLCTRCKREAITPDKNKMNPDHPAYDMEQYQKDLKNYNEMRALYRDSYNSKPMGGPQFAFTRKDNGLPVHPTIV
jgi:hypothetical protein